MAQVTVHNPAPKRATKGANAMAARKRKKRRTKKRKGTSKRKSTTRRRKRRSSPSKRRRRSSARRRPARRRNPRRRRNSPKRSTRTAQVSGRRPTRRRRKGRRPWNKGRKNTKWKRIGSYRRRTNPGPIGSALIAGAIGVAAYAGAMLLSQFIDGKAHLQAKNINPSYVGGGIVAALGAFLAKKHGVYGAGVAAGGLVAAIGAPVAVKVMQAMPASVTGVQTTTTTTPAATAPATTVKGLFMPGGMSGVQQLGLGAVFQGMHGAASAQLPIAPWASPNPFGGGY